MITFDNALLAAKNGGKQMRKFSQEELALLNPAEDDPHGYPVRKGKLADYLYYTVFEGLNYEEAYKYFRSRGDYRPAACSAIRKGIFYGRNLDWYYSDEAEFVVQSNKYEGIYASIGVAGGFGKLTDEYVENTEKDKLYKMIPFQLQDGINEYGVVASYNVVPTDYGHNVVEPAVSKELEIDAIMLVRYILDHFMTAEAAAEYIRDYCRVIFPKALHAANYELQVMIADQDATLLLNFADNETNIIDVTEDAPYITNFHRLNVELNRGGTVYTPATMTETENAFDTNHITLHGAGLERFNIIAEAYAGLGEIEDMRALLDDLRYTKMYITAPDTADPAWLTEYCGGSLTVKTDPEDFKDIEEAAGQAYTDRDRDDPKTWQTVHSVIYDISTKTMYVRVQENAEEFKLPLKS